MTDNCGSGEDDHEVLVKIEFDLIQNDGDEGTTTVSAAIHTHVHNTPVDVAAQTLATIAVKMLSDHLSHAVFGDIEDHDLAHAMGAGSAKAALIQLITNLPDQIELASLSIPDDLSELLEEGN